MSRFLDAQTTLLAYYMFLNNDISSIHTLTQYEDIASRSLVLVVSIGAIDCLERLLQNDLLCVKRDVRPYTLTHSQQVYLLLYIFTLGRSF